MRRKVPQKLACRMGMGKSGGAKLKAGARAGTVTTAKDELLLWNQTAPKSSKSQNASIAGGS